MIDVEDFKAASTRLLAKLPRLEAVERREGHLFPRLEIETGPSLYFGYAAAGEEGSLEFWGLEQRDGHAPGGSWRPLALDPDGNVVDGEARHRIRRMELDDGSAEQGTRSWPQFAKASKVRPPG